MVLTYKNKFNKKYGFDKDASHSIAEIAKLTGYKKSGLDTIFEKGKGAFFSNRASVRPQVKHPNNGLLPEYIQQLLLEVKHLVLMPRI